MISSRHLSMCFLASFLLCLLPACADGAITATGEGPPRTLPDGGFEPDQNAAGVVFFPNGSCETGALEVQIAGAPHPTHPRLNAGDCLMVNKSVALSSLQVRCVDPNGVRPPSAWVGPAIVDGAADVSLCEQVLE